jgi:uncharacterized membrane protein YgcG
VEWLWLIVAAGGAGFAAKWWRNRRSTRRAEADELLAVRRLADDDVADLGARLRRLDDELGGEALDEETQVARRTAHDAHACAVQALSGVSGVEDVRTVTAAVAEGHHALACARARAVGASPPDHRAVCFFNPQHGRSAAEVLWTRPGHGARSVPACSSDADRVARHEAPDVRTVTVGARTMPYWAAGSAFLPYTQGYFAGTATLSWALRPGEVEGAPDKAGYFGTGIVGSSGHFDGGGFDGSGGNSGGGF